MGETLRRMKEDMGGEHMEGTLRVVPIKKATTLLISTIIIPITNILFLNGLTIVETRSGMDEKMEARASNGQETREPGVT
jgi:hypothetical protein